MIPEGSIAFYIGYTGLSIGLDDMGLTYGASATQACFQNPGQLH
jgi:hypothetical protein